MMFDRRSTGQRPVPSESLLILLTQRMRVLAEPVRMRLLFVLECHQGTVQELADELLLPHQNVSKHLNVLYKAGVVSRVRAGSCMNYTLADYTVLQVIRQATDGLTGYIGELAELADPSE
jgi:DNA-binding transcriptional ArsR family regulator